MLQLCTAWESNTDHKWHSNALWYDFLQIFNHQTGTPSLTSCTTLKVALEAPNNSFEAQSLLDFIKGHLENEHEHLIAAMIHRFTKTFPQEYTGSSGDLLPHILANPVESCQKIIIEIKHFILLCIRGMMHYYGKIVSKVMRNKPGEMSQFFVEYILVEPVSSIIIELLYLSDKEAEDEYQKKFVEHQHLKCRDLGLEDWFRLDENEDGAVGFAKAIEKLQEIQTKPNPLDKVYVIYEMTALICKSVDEYWLQFRGASTSKVVINADQIMSIFIYIVIKGRIGKLGAHLKLAYEFGRQAIQQGSLDYYLATLEASVSQVAHLNAESLARLG